MRVAPLAVQLIVGGPLLVIVWAPVNWMVQVVRKPAEVFGAVSGSLAKVPAQTWRQYGPLFDEHSTAVVTPELLAALAQVESSGNPVARTYWRWRFSWNPFELYRPASSAVGMFQITDGTFAEARRYCIHDHVVVEDGPWHDPHSCWFNALYTRVVAGHAVEMTAALLDRDGRAHPRPPPHREPRRCSSGRTSRRSSTCAEAAPVTATRAGASDSAAASDAATTTPAATLPRSTR